VTARLDGGRSSWDIEDVQLAARCGLDGVFPSGIVRDVISIKNVVVPVPLTLLDQRALEAEGTLKATRLGCVFGKGKLSCIIVPRAKKMDCFAVRRGAKTEVQLNRRHYRYIFVE
jgi:hypothetical protein